MALNNQGAPRAPSAPSAPSVRSTRGTSQQNRGQLMKNSGGAAPGAVQPRAGKPNQGNKGPSGGVAPDPKAKPQHGPNWKSPLEKQRERERRRREREANNPAPSAPAATPPPTQPAYEPKPDPRDDQYWANRTALENTYAVDVQRLDAQQVQANNAYALDSAQMDEYNRRRQQAIAMARLGRGIRSGGAREERALNDMDYLIDTERRRSDKVASDADREMQKSSLAIQLQSDIFGEDQAAAQRMAESMLQEAEQSPGDAQNLEGTFQREDLQRGISQTTKRIKALREKQADAGPKQKEILDKRIRQLQQRRTKMKGKL